MNRICRVMAIFVILFFIMLPGLYARGGVEVEAQSEYAYPETVFYVCSFVTAASGAIDASTGLSITNTLLSRFKAIEFRQRNEAELQAYTDSIWEEKKTAAADALRKKRQERDALLFKGLKDWKYRTELEKIDQSIQVLEERLESIERKAPLVAQRPVFRLAEENLNGVFALSPQPGAELALARQKKADILLFGEISDYHGRILVRVQLYSTILNDLFYDDFFIFSPENRTASLDQMFAELSPYISGQKNSYIRVSAEPADSVISVGDLYSGRIPVYGLPVLPGNLSVSVFSQGHEHTHTEIRIEEGYSYTVHAVLKPIAYEALNIVTDDNILLYMDAVYQGSGSTTLMIPKNTAARLTLKDQSNNERSYIVPGKSGILTFDDISIPDSVSSVEESRKRLYQAYGRLWIALPAAFILSGISKSYIDAANYGGNPEIFSKAYTSYYISAGAWIVAGCFLAESIYRIGRYVYTAETRSSSFVDTVQQAGSEQEDQYR